MYNIKLFYDLHIHSVLSPDADDFMTPNNILNMAMLKELDFVAITDHNSAKQLRVVQQIEEAYDFVFIPGIEVTVKEGFDVLCYFKHFKDAYDLDEIIESHLNGAWGPFKQEDQMITDIYDITIDTYEKPLLQTDLSYQELYTEVKKRQGAIVLAHIDRNSKSVLNNYSLADFPFDGIEIQLYYKSDFLSQNPELQKHKIFANSDSHTLLTISERIESIELKEKTIDAFFQYLLGE